MWWNDFLRMKRAEWGQKAAKLEYTQRLYEAAKVSEHRTIPRDTRSAKAVTEHTGDKLRRWGRYLDENLDIVTGIFDDLVINTVGGIQVEPLVTTTTGKEHKATNEQLAEDWAAWTEHPTIDGKFSFQKIINLMCRTYYRDGEVLNEHLLGKNYDHPNGIVPYSIRPIEPDYLPFDLNSDSITHGILYGGDGKETGFYLYKAHPGSSMYIYPTKDNTRFVDARQLTHVPFVKRLHAGRGVPIIHAIVTRLDDIKDLEESERIRARWAAMQIGAIVRNENFDGPSEENAAGNRVFDSDVGTIYDNFQVGEDLKMFESNTPNDKLPDHLKDQMRRVAAGSRSMYSNITRDYSTSYSAQRQELVTHVLYRYEAQKDFNGHMVRRAIWRNFVMAELAYNRIKLPKTIKESTLFNPVITVYPPPWIDPDKETNANINANGASLKPKAYIIREMGYDPRQVQAELERERERELKQQEQGQPNGQKQNPEQNNQPPGDTESDDGE